MPQLPRVVVLGAGPTGVAALYGLVDGGLWAIVVGLADRADADRADADPAGATEPVPPDPSPAAAFGARFGLLDRIRLVPAPVTVQQAEPAGPFTVHGGPGSIEVVADAVVVADPRLAPAAWITDPARLFLGIFDLGRDRVFHLGGEPTASGRPDGTGGSGEAIRMQVAEAQGRLLGEHLRGRYLLPPAEVTAGGGASGGRRSVERLVDQVAGRLRRGAPTPPYLRAMGRELARGHARAGVAGYPLPWPRLS